MRKEGCKAFKNSKNQVLQQSAESGRISSKRKLNGVCNWLLADRQEQYLLIPEKRYEPVALPLPLSSVGLILVALTPSNITSETIVLASNVYYLLLSCDDNERSTFDSLGGRTTAKCNNGALCFA